MKYDYTEDQILKAAIAAHECNRVFCVAIGDNSQVTWEWAPEWQKESAINGVKGVINGDGPVKDADKKEHPCLVAYNDLPYEQQAKDSVYVAVVNAVLNSLRTMEESLPGI